MPEPISSVEARVIQRATVEFGGLLCKEFYDRTLDKCHWRTSFTEDTVLMALDTLVEMGWIPPGGVSDA